MAKKAKGKSKKGKQAKASKKSKAKTKAKVKVTKKTAKKKSSASKAKKKIAPRRRAVASRTLPVQPPQPVERVFSEPEIVEPEPVTTELGTEGMQQPPKESTESAGESTSYYSNDDQNN